MSKTDSAAPAVRNALAAAEASSPGIALELTLAIIKKTELNVGLNEAILRLQGSPDDNEGSSKTITSPVFYCEYFEFIHHMHMPSCFFK